MIRISKIIKLSEQYSLAYKIHLTNSPDLLVESSVN